MTRVVMSCCTAALLVSNWAQMVDKYWQATCRVSSTHKYARAACHAMP
jgi:hypothetical protein